MPISNHDPTSIPFDGLLPLKDMKRGSDTRASYTEHVPELFMSQRNLIAFDAIMIHQDPSRGTTLDRMDEVRDNRSTHLGGESTCKPQQYLAQRRTLPDRSDQVLHRKALSGAVPGSYLDVIWPAIIPHQDGPADNTFAAYDTDREAPAVSQNIEKSRQGTIEEANRIDGISGFCQRIAEIKLNSFEIWVKQLEIVFAHALKQYVTRSPIGEFLSLSDSIKSPQNLLL